MYILRINIDTRNAFIPSSRVANEHEECRDVPTFFPRDTPTPACRHRSEVCFDCLKRTIKKAVKAGRFDADGTRVRCPSIGCNKWMNPSDSHVSQALFQSGDNGLRSWFHYSYEKLVKRISNAVQTPPRCFNPQRGYVSLYMSAVSTLTRGNMEIQKVEG